MKVAYFSRESGLSALEQLRIIAPLTHADIEIVNCSELGSGNVDCINEADLVLFQRDFPSDLDAYNHISNYARSVSKPVVYDIDDLLIDLPENHPDRKKGYYAPALLPMLQATIDADLITTSSSKLRQTLLQYNNNVSVLPNFLDDNIWKFKNLKRKSNHKTTIIGYMGGVSHEPDLELITPVLLDLIKQYSTSIKFVFYGVKPPKVIFDLPQVNWLPSKTLNYKEFAEDFQLLDVDIFIAPLVYNLFNRCKSSIKFLEYSTLSVPGVFSRLEPYTDVVSDNENGLLASSLDEWYEQLVRLINDCDLRCQLALNAQETSKKEWIMSRNAYLWQDAYKDLLRKAPSHKHLITFPDEVFRSFSQQLNEYHTLINESCQPEKNTLVIKANVLSESFRIISNINSNLIKLENEKDGLREKLEKQEERNRELVSKIDLLTNESTLVTKKLEHLEQINGEQFHRLEVMNQISNGLLSTIEEYKLNYNNLSSLYDATRRELDDIHVSKAWRFATFFRKVKLKIAPTESPQSRFITKTYKILINPLQNVIRRKQFRKDIKLLKKSDLFKQAWYKANNPDIDFSKTDPLRHYLIYGAFEGRDPSPEFSSDWYLKVNSDVKRANMNPLIHYLRYGITEGRLPKGVGSAFNQENKFESQSILANDNNTNEQRRIIEDLSSQESQESPIVEQREQNSVDDKSLQKAEERAEFYKNQLDAFYQTNTYKFTLALRRLRLKLAPYGTKRDLAVNRLIKTIKRTLQREKQLIKPGGVKSESLISINLTNVSIAESRTLDILQFPIIGWHFRYQRPQQIASELASMGYRVFYFSEKFNISNEIKCEQIKENLFVINLPGYEDGNIYSQAMSTKMLQWFNVMIKQLQTAFNINFAFSLVDHPFWSPLVFKLRDDYNWKIVYDLMDFHKGFSATSSKSLIHEEKLLTDSDLVLVTSNPLMELASKAKKTLLVPNACDYDHFHNKEKTTPTPLVEFTHPIIGYYGAISDWFDTKLVGELANDHPEWTFILIGDTTGSDLRPFRNVNNVTLLGEKPYADLPDYLSEFDICVIPFKKTPLTEATNPVKLFEFMSAGKPVVATRLRELSYYEDMIELVDTKEDWNMVLSKILREPQSAELIEKRYAFAKQNTWLTRTQLIHSKITDLFPRISIIVITYNNIDYSMLCIDSILTNTKYPNYEIIIVDNGSIDNTRAYLDELAKNNNRIKTIYNDANLGFARANNQGAKIATGELIVFLNNDTFVTPGWLFNLYNHLEKDPKIGMIGPVSNNVGNEAKIDVPYTCMDPSDICVDDVINFSRTQMHTKKDSLFEIKMLALFCTMIRKDLFWNLNGLDERYGIGMFEDDDLAIKVRNAGFKIVCAEDVFIHHFMRASFSKLPKPEYDKLFKENREKFEQKWRTTWIAHKARQ